MNRFADHGVRKYDYDIGRFTSSDVLFEKYAGWTPYQYSANNPINLVDGNGKFKIPASGTEMPFLKTKDALEAQKEIEKERIEPIINIEQEKK